MGTSKGYGAPTTPQWSRLKREVGQATGDGAVSADDAAALLANFVTRTGGAQSLTTHGLSGISYGSGSFGGGGRGGRRGSGGGRAGGGQTSAAVRTGQRISGFSAGISTGGLDGALQDAGLGHLVGRPAKEVFRGLVDYFCGDGSTLEEVDLREAMIDLRNELIGEQQTYDEIKARLEQVLDPARLATTMKELFGFYVFRQFQRIFHEKLVQAHGIQKVKGMLGQIKTFVRERVALITTRHNLLPSDWRGVKGRTEVQKICLATYTAFERLR